MNICSARVVCLIVRFWWTLDTLSANSLGAIRPSRCLPSCVEVLVLPFSVEDLEITDGESPPPGVWFDSQIPQLLEKNKIACDLRDGLSQAKQACLEERSAGAPGKLPWNLETLSSSRRGVSRGIRRMVIPCGCGAWLRCAQTQDPREMTAVAFATTMEGSVHYDLGHKLNPSRIETKSPKAGPLGLLG